MDNSDVFEHQDIEQIILINQMLKNNVRDNEKSKKHSIDLSRINHPIIPSKKSKSLILVQQNSQSIKESKKHKPIIMISDSKNIN